MMSKRVTQFAAGLTMALVCGWSGMVSLRAQQAPQFAGATDRGFVLPNAWVLNPAGEQILLADLPLNIIPLADNRHVLAATSGYNTHELTLIDLASRTIVDRQAVQQSWFGLATSPGGRQIWWSGGGGDLLHTFQLEDRHLKRTSGAEPPRRREGRDGPRHFRSGIALDPHRHVLYSLDVDGGTISVLDPKTLEPIKSAPAGKRPYDVAVARNGTRLFVSDWAERAIRVLEPGELRTSRQHRCGRAPQSDRRPSPGRSDLRGLRIERLRLGHRHPARDRDRDDPHGPVPEGTGRQHSRCPGGRTRRQDALRGQRRQQLRRRHRHRGARPQPGQGLHPHGLVSDRGRGHARRQEPPGRRRQGEPDQAQPDRSAQGPGEAGGTVPRRAYRSRLYPYIGTTLSGALSIVPIPDDKELARFTETVYRNCPYSDKLLTDAHHPEKTAIPTKVGEPSPIKHVLYIIKENRTYDQVFGDMSRGQRRSVAGDVRPRGDAQPSQARRGVRAAGQPLLQRPRLGGRPPLVDDGLQHRLHRPQLGADVLEPGRDPRRRRRRPVERPVGLSLGRLRPSRPELSELRRIRAAGQRARWLDPDGGSGPGTGRAHVPGLRRLQGPRPAASATPTTPTRSSGNSASSRRRASCRGSW